MEPVHALLRHRHQKSCALGPEPFRRPVATLVDRELGSDRVPVIFYHPVGAIFAARFLVGIHHHLDAASERDVVALQREHRHQRHNSMRLVIDRTARPYIAVGQVGAERRMRPVGSHSGHHVAMRHQHQRFHARGSRHPRDQGHHSGLALKGLVRDSFLVENSFQVGHRAGGIARRIGGVEAKISAEIIERFGIDLVPIDLRRGIGVRSGSHES